MAMCYSNRHQPLDILVKKKMSVGWALPLPPKNGRNNGEKEEDEKTVGDENRNYSIQN